MKQSKPKHVIPRSPDKYELGQRFGVRGTPAIYLPDGTMVPGYLPPDEIIQRIGG